MDNTKLVQPQHQATPIKSGPAPLAPEDLPKPDTVVTSGNGGSKWTLIYLILAMIIMAIIGAGVFFVMNGQSRQQSPTDQAQQEASTQSSASTPEAAQIDQSLSSIPDIPDETDLSDIDKDLESL